MCGPKRSSRSSISARSRFSAVLENHDKDDAFSFPTPRRPRPVAEKPKRKNEKDSAREILEKERFENARRRERRQAGSGWEIFWRYAVFEFLLHLKSLPKITLFNPLLSALPLADSVFYSWFMILIFETIGNLWIYFSSSFFEMFRLLFYYVRNRVRTEDRTRGGKEERNKRKQKSNN